MTDTLSAAQVEQAKRSIRPEIRNPMLALPAMQTIIGYCQRDEPIPPTVLRELLIQVHFDAYERAQTQWRKHKAPMAFYWKVVAVYAGHIMRAMRPILPRLL